jgi:hypothetical protein
LTETVRPLDGMNWKFQSEILQKIMEKKNRKRAKPGAHNI